MKAFGIRKLGLAITSTVAAILGVALLPTSAKANPIDLGAAGNYSVFALQSFSYNGPGVINGNVAVGQSTNFAAPAQINGTVFLNNGVSQQGNIVPTGGFTHADLTQAMHDAENAVTQAQSLTATQTVSSLGNNSTLTGDGGVNVIDVGGIGLSGGTLTLHGSASDYFVINDSGNFTFSNSGITLTGGVTASHVLFDVSGSVTITGGGTENFYGTILAPNSNVSVHDKTLTGELIGGTIADTSGFQVVPAAVPEPSVLALGALAMGALTTRRRRASIAAA